MKHFSVFVQFLFCCAFLTSLTSCGQDEKEVVEETPAVAITTSITPQEYTDIVGSIDEAIMGSTRSLGQELTDMEARNLLQPFVNDGKQIRNQMITLQRDLELTNDDITLLEGMTDDELAQVSFTLVTICNTGKGITFNDFIDCLKYASGISDVQELMKTLSQGGLSWYGLKGMVQGTKMLLNARTAKQICKIFAKRAVGFVGVAWFAYDLADCLQKKK